MVYISRRNITEFDASNYQHLCQYAMLRCLIFLCVTKHLSDPLKTNLTLFLLRMSYLYFNLHIFVKRIGTYTYIHKPNKKLINRNRRKRNDYVSGKMTSIINLHILKMYIDVIKEEYLKHAWCHEWRLS